MRDPISLNCNWRFHLGEAEGAYYRGYDDRAWDDITLPHDWSVAMPFDEKCSSGTGYLPGGVGWYRKRFELPPLTGRRAYLLFGGAYKRAKAWVNSNYLGMRAYGYSSFAFDITEFVRHEENVISVRCEHVETADSRWYTGSGLYRGVTLIVVPDQHFALDGVFARTARASEDEAEIRVTAEVLGGGEPTYVLLDADGREVAGGGERLIVTRPTLWSPEVPYLYTLVASLASGDSVRIPFGIRTFRFGADDGFFLNGQSMKLRGVCLHHDAGALGAAVPAAVWTRRLSKLKEAGVNAIRFSHNPPDPGLLDLCDRLGFLAMDEAFDEWEGCKNKWWQGHNVYPPKHFGYAEDFPEWHERDLADLVRRDRNHPSIILWSIGNEIDYPNDPYVHAAFDTATGNNDYSKPAEEREYDPDKPDAGRLAIVAKKLVAIAKRHDDSRPVTSALAFPEVSNLTGYAQTLDVVGYNYKEPLYDEDHRKYPSHILLGSENSHEARTWLAVRRRDFISGQFLWTGIDYLGEAHGWPIRVAQAGLLDTAGFEKPRFAHRKALWTDALCARLAVGASGRMWEADFVWTGTPGEDVKVLALTNGDSAVLELNGVEVGSAQVSEECMAAFSVPYAPGTLKLTVTRGDDRVEDELTTSGAATSIQAHTVENLERPADGQGIWQVEIELLDAAGRLAATDDRPIRCQVVGDMEFLVLENGCAHDLTSYASATRPTWRGRAIAFLRAGTQPGKAKLYLSSPGLPAAEVELTLTKVE